MPLPPPNQKRKGIRQTMSVKSAGRPRFMCFGQPQVQRCAGFSATVFAFFALGSCLANAAVTNTFSIKESEGATTQNYPIQIGREFMDAPSSLAIQNFPQVGICTDATCSTISQWLTTQADVKNRFASGYVKFSIISFLIPTLKAGSTMYFTFQNQLSCNCGPGSWETKANMLANYNFDAQMQLTSNSATQTASARAILTNWDGASNSQLGPVFYWAGGTVATTVVLCDQSGTYDMGFNGKTVRPMFIATFWPATQQVKIRFVGENASSTAWTDQTYALTLLLGNSSPAVVYKNAKVVHAAGTRWTVTENNQVSGWQVSTPSGTITLKQETWLGAVPPPAAVNHNLAYLAASKVTPNYDASRTISEAQLASDWNYQQQGSSDIYGGSNNCWGPGAYHAWGNTGAASHIGPEPLWTLRYLYSGDIREQEIAHVCSDQGGAFSFHFRENAPNKNITRASGNGCSYQCGVNGQGRILSISQRPTFMSTYLTYSYTAQADAVVVAGPYLNPNNNYNNAGFFTGDTSHQPDITSALYLVTGDWFYLEETWFLGSFSASADNGAATTVSYGRGPTGAEGGVGYDGGEVRAMAWGLRALYNAAFVSPDNTPEKSYFETLTNDWVAIEEGARCTSADVFPWCASSPFHGNGNWQWGITTRSQVNNGMGYPTLHQWQRGGPIFVQGSAIVASAYGINFSVGAGTASNTGGASSTVKFSDATACSHLLPNTNVYLGGDASGNVSYVVQLTSVSCPNATMSSALDLSGFASGANSEWQYSPTVQEAESEFSADYLMFALGRGQELGYPTSNLVSWYGQFFTGLITDPGSNPRLAFTGRVPTINVATGQYFNSYSSLKTGWQPNWQALTSGYGPAGESDTFPPEGYAAYAMAATSYLTNLPNGPAAWSFMASNVLPDASFNDNPHWALIPRGATGSPAPPPPSKCDLNADGVINILDVQLATDEVLGKIPCTMSACTSASVNAIAAAALGGSCTLQ